MITIEDDIISSLTVLQQGGIILYPTDTIWGIGCDADNTDAVQKIYSLKKREEKKSMIILLADEDDIVNYVKEPAKKIMDFLAGQKKPTTAIFENAFNLSRALINADGSIAIRFVKDEFCQTLIRRLHKPLVSTSANISGSASPQNFEMVNASIKKGVDYIVQHRRHELKMYEPSSIIKLNKEGNIEKIR